MKQPSCRSYAELGKTRFFLVLLTSIPQEIIRKPKVFSWFRREKELINSFKFALHKK